VADPAAPRLWSRAVLALVFSLYGWSMMAVELYLTGARVPEGPDRGLVLFRRLVMGRAVVGLGGAAVLAALVLGFQALAARRQPRIAMAALVISALWVLCLARLWPI